MDRDTLMREVGALDRSQRKVEHTYDVKMREFVLKQLENSASFSRITIWYIGSMAAH